MGLILLEKVLLMFEKNIQISDKLCDYIQKSLPENLAHLKYCLHDNLRPELNKLLKNKTDLPLYMGFHPKIDEAISLILRGNKIKFIPPKKNLSISIHDYAKSRKKDCARLGNIYTGPSLEWSINLKRDYETLIGLEITNSPFFMLELDVNGEEKQLLFKLGLFFITFYLYVGFFKVPFYETRTTGISIHHWSIWISIWQNKHQWKGGDWDWSVNIPDLFLGSSKYTPIPISTHHRTLNLPEGSYGININMIRGLWKRPRWPMPTVIMKAEVIPEKPIPVPGKGENSWDCDEDSIQSSMFPAETPEEALDKFYKDIMDTRKKRGWK